MVLLPLISFSLLLLLLLADSHGTIATLPCQEDKDASGVNTGSPYAPSGLTCYREWTSDEQMSGDKPFRCTWIRGRDPAEYRLCYCCDTCKTCKRFQVGNNTSHILHRDDFYLTKNLTFWVETTGGKAMVKSAKLYVVPQNTIKYAPLSMEKVDMARTANLLTLRWKKPEMKGIFNQIRYRRLGSEVWNQTICNSSESKTHENCTIQLHAAFAHQLQIRRMLQNIWSEWSDVAFIPAAITKRLELQWKLVDNLPQCPGKRLVELKWQSPTEPDIGVTGYRLTIRPLIDGMRRISEELNQTSYKTTLSLAPYKVSVVALNRVGTSPPQTIAIAAGQHQGPPNLNLSVVDNHTLRASWSDRSTSFYCAILELVSTETIQHNRCLSIKHQERKKNNGLPKSTGPQGTADARTMEFVGLEPLRRYRLTVYVKDLKEKKKCRGKTGSTIGQVRASIDGESRHGTDGNLLTLRWKKPEMKGIFNQIRYRRLGSEVWNQTICNSSESKTHENCTIQLHAAFAHQLQIRRMLQNIWSEWSDVAFIPAAITKRLELQWKLVDNLPQCPGKRLVELKWQPRPFLVHNSPSLPTSSIISPESLRLVSKSI
ncbi:interleukin-12 receptor subunit beta-1 [Amblyraja radiata]|uniref:interleukin-12 receptor subunit beta-1 n=1 Tax=Amblyraja radiata TaxID=386614 RepID=UPI001403A7BD|nr:interleukin-12 receptor subunit beta-1 [Amblyraja radiata]